MIHMSVYYEPVADVGSLSCQTLCATVLQNQTMQKDKIHQARLLYYVYVCTHHSHGSHKMPSCCEYCVNSLSHSHRNQSPHRHHFTMHKIPFISPSLCTNSACNYMFIYIMSPNSIYKSAIPTHLDLELRCSGTGSAPLHLSFRHPHYV